MSRSRSRFITWAFTALVFTYLVITAGSVVRATGSGMGCPDWPKCFGHYIPPTQLDQLEFAEGKHFKKGYFIIWERALWKAKHDLTAGPEINLDNWQKYTKHDYARFNAMHTWTEYANRLSGALLGVVSIIMLATAFWVRREDRALPWLAALAVFLIGFEGWLGATVVASNLMPAKITTHMIVALVIVAVIITTISRARSTGGAAGAPSARISRGMMALLLSAVAITLVQILLGTQVRERVDTLDKMWNGTMRSQWVNQLGTVFRVHALLAYGVLILNGTLIYLLKQNYSGWERVRRTAVAIVLLLLIEWMTGATMALFNIPAVIQPTHLVIATLIFGLQFSLWIQLRKNGRSEVKSVSGSDDAADALAE